MPCSIASLLLATFADFSSRCFCSLEMAELISVLSHSKYEARSGRGILLAFLP